MNCTKCGQLYKEDDVEAYLCPNCLTERKQMAKQIDVQFVGRSKSQPMTPLQQYDMAQKFHGFPKA